MTPARRTEKVLGLLHLRERLAIAAAEYEAHDLDGAAEVFQQQLDIESSIRVHAPDVYEARWTEWLERDAQLAHTECWTSKFRATSPLPWWMPTGTVPTSTWMSMSGQLRVMRRSCRSRD